MEEMIRLRGVAKSFRGVRVLDGLDLEVPAGSVFALLGPNGAGKTTTISVIATLTRPDAGQARVAGFDVVAQAHEVRRRISLTGQAAAVDELLTGEENLRMLARLSGLRGAASRRRTAELIERFDLGDAAPRRVASYSGGMRRRLDLALSLVFPAPVVILDEPTTGLDPRSRNALWTAIRELADEGTTVLLTTQYLEEADQLADRVALLHRGALVAEGAPDTLKAMHGADATLDDVFLALTADDESADLALVKGAR